METKSLKALALKVLEGNKQGNSKETFSFHDGNSEGVSFPESFPSETQGNTALLLDPSDVENLFKVLKMKLSDFKQAGLLIRIKAGVLDGEYIYLASSAKEAETGKAEGLITYTA
ncbi:MAG: hypothetical protein HZA08_01725, partial [Nitrospirae bacterium]|nr:hypothetical protein [Nitrospirota bacterium]